MSSKSENWLLVEWSGGNREVVYVKSVINPINTELKIGDSLTANRRGKAHPAKLLARARERHELDEKLEDKAAGPSTKNEEDTDESVASGSSWEPSDDGVLSGDSDKVSAKKIKLDLCKRKYSNRRSNKTAPMPTSKGNAIIPKSMQQAKHSVHRKQTHKDNDANSSVNYLTDSTRKNTTKNNDSAETVSINIEEIISIKNSFRMLFKMIEELKRSALPNGVVSEVGRSVVDMSVINITESLVQQTDTENNESEEFNRSDDNVLITNKYKKQRTAESNEPNTAEANEWVPIGSGKTLIHVDQFKKVNWRSYTIATRTLLLAVFPRRILATHSLTGKRSPAFQNKPAKMCLDPKIISDVIMEIMDRFDVKENLVRSIITTKCADECKMWKAKMKKKKSQRSENFENIPPEENENLKHDPIIL